MPTRLLLTVVATLLLAACGGTDDPGSPTVEGDGKASDPAGAWELADSEPTIEVPPDARVTLEVTADGDAWQVGGTSACNSYGGTVVTDGSAWRAEGFGATEMGCDGSRMTAERDYLDALHRVDTWARPSGDVLVLTGPDVELRFGRLPPVPTAELTATTWELDGLVAGTGPDASVSSTAGGADPATLRLEPGGTMEASTGCRTFTGEWEETGDEVLLTTFGVRDDSPNVDGDGTPACDGAVVEQEHHVLSVLGDGFRAEIEGQQLTLISRDGLGLTYRAVES